MIGAILFSAPGFAFAERLTGSVVIDGSSTLYPITEAVAEEFLAIQPKVRVKVGISGTGGGFKKFLMGETDINDASRPIKEKEQKTAKEKGVEFIELPVAFDGISVVVNPKNSFVDYLTVEELRKIWQPDSTVKKWSDVRKGWPDKAITLYGPGTDSGTFDYFTGEINGKEQSSRSDFTASEDDNVLVQGVNGDEGALGYFGYAYYTENKSRLKIVPVKSGNKPAVTPTVDTIMDGSYSPLARPIFIYISKKSSQKPEVKAFVNFYIENAGALAEEVGYVPLPETVYASGMKRFSNGIAGSLFLEKYNKGKSIEQLYK
ncbi:MAG: PstS family phosphate ABC transporter substrate-binding protein [Nitrospinota bacterium]|nr:PstS family phosphate ABC transporter substrate-binding protein [Nitrospinota bacterium]